MRNEPARPGGFSGERKLRFGGAARGGGGRVSRFAGTSAHADQAAAALPAGHAAVVDGRTLFPTRVFAAGDAPRVLVSGHNSAKIGAVIAKGAWAGMPVVTLTLEERATCPSSCQLWRECYGNAMPLSRRHRLDAALIAALDAELRALAAAHPGGFAVRVHVLGDFRDLDYLGHWVRWMAAIPALHVWGYTAHRRESPIGMVIAEANEFWPDRWVVRFSVPPGERAGRHQATTIWRRDVPAVVPEGIVCPAQTHAPAAPQGREAKEHATAACATCGLCWAPAAAGKRIVFIGHGMRGRGGAPPGDDVGSGDMDAMADVPAGGDLAPDAVVELVRRALSGRTDPAALQAAREEGYRQGHAEGRAEADGAWRARLSALIGAPAEAPAAAQVAAPAAAEMADDADDADPEADAEREVSPQDSGPEPAAPEPAVSERGGWKTPAREALLRQLWPDFERSVRSIRLSLRGLPGPAMPDADASIYSWAKVLALGPRSGGGGPALAAANAARRVRAAQARIDAAMPADDATERDASAAEAEEAPVALLPQGEMRETPGLKRARELLAMGLHPNDIAAAVRLTSAEMDAVRRAHRGLAA